MCPSCNTNLPIGDFFKNRSRSDGLSYECKSCYMQRVRRVPSRCVQCGGGFVGRRSEARRFCSRSCVARFYICNKNGSSNPNWKGGVTSEINRFYHSKEWKELRRKAFERDDFTCQEKSCGQRGGRLEAKHIKPPLRCFELPLGHACRKNYCIDDVMYDNVIITRSWKSTLILLHTSS